MATDLLSAAKNGYLDLVVSLLTSGGPCDVNARDKDKATPLYWSASRGHLKICKVLLKAGCDVNACVKWGSTALHGAADRGHVDCLVTLIDSDAQVNIQNERGDTALHLAAYRGFKDITQELVKAWADPFIKNNQSKTPLQEAQSQQHHAVADVLQKYVESLGCLPFKSLPDWHGSKANTKSPQDQRGYSEPGSSWPQFQSFPKVSDNIPPTELSRPHAYPIRTFNNLSWEPYNGMGGNVKGGVTGVNSGFGETSGPAEGLRRHSVFLQQQQYTHGEPEENCEHCVAPTGDGSNNHHCSSNGVPAGGNHPFGNRSCGDCYPRMEVDSVLEFQLQQQQQYSGIHSSKVMTANGQRRPTNNLDGADGITSYLTPPPDLAPPAPQHSGSRFVKHEDLTEFAETLQLEVVKLRDSLASKEKQVSELRVTMASLAAQNTRLQRELSEAAQRTVSPDALAFKDAQLAEAREQASSLDKQNARLKLMLSQQQEKAKGESSHRDSVVSELTTKVKNLERLNSTLQQLIVTQQDALKDTLAKKDAENVQMKQALEEMFRERASLRQAVLMKTQKDCVDTEISDQSPEGWRNGDETRVVDSSNRTVPSSVMTSRTGAAESASKSSPHPGSSSETSRSVISVCDQSAIHPSVLHTRPSSALTQGLCGQGTVDTPSSGLSASATSGNVTTMSSASLNSRTPHFHGSTPGVQTSSTHALMSTSSSQPQSVSNRNSSPGQGAELSSKRVSEQAVLRESVSRQFHDTGDAGKLDAVGREWTVGKDFHLLEDRPVNCSRDGQRSGSCSLVFSIGHKDRKYMLKMMMNLINLTCEAHSLGRSLDAHLLHRFGAEFHAPLLPPPHPNIVRVRHHYQGDTTHFLKYLPLLVPATLDVPLEMARRTTFLVMDQYPQTLQSFFSGYERRGGGGRGEGEGDGRGGMEGGGVQLLHQLPSQFFVQLVYQLLSAVAYLQRYHVVHRDVKADNIFLDWRLRPVMGDFGLARTLRTYDGQPVAFTNQDQVFAGNAHAWAPELSRWSKADLPEVERQSMTLEDVYSKSDAFAVSRMFYHLLGADAGDDFTTTTTATTTTTTAGGFLTSSLYQPHYQDSTVPALTRPLTPALAHVLKSLVLDDPAKRPTAEQARCSVGVLLCKPPSDLTSPQEADMFYTSQLRNLASKSSVISPGQPDDGQTLSIADSVETNQNSCLADFLFNFSSKDFWEAYNELRTLGLLD